MNWNAYFRLARVHHPIGIFLLWWPTAWALWFANRNHPPLRLVLVFFLGTLLMRSAGCIINDLADRHIDPKVQRTKNRPLAAGILSIRQAFHLLALLLMGALLLLFFLPFSCFIYALMALLISCLYPFCKRYLQCPQLVLGVAFSMSIPMVFAASGKLWTDQAWLLWWINFLWIVAYDTEYALADKADDLNIGVRSTAIYFSPYEQTMIAFLQIFFHLGWLLLLPVNKAFLIMWVIGGLMLVHQHRLLERDRERYALRAFKNNNYYGCIMWLGILLSLR